MGATVLILGGCVLFLVGAVVGLAIGSYARLLKDVADSRRRITELEALVAMKPNSRAAMEARDAYEYALWAVTKATEDASTAALRLENLKALLSNKATEVMKGNSKVN